MLKGEEKIKKEIKTEKETGSTSGEGEPGCGEQDVGGARTGEGDDVPTPHWQCHPQGRPRTSVRQPPQNPELRKVRQGGDSGSNEAPSGP